VREYRPVGTVPTFQKCAPAAHPEMLQRFRVQVASSLYSSPMVSAMDCALYLNANGQPCA
jgi:hypothetical protein